MMKFIALVALAFSFNSFAGNTTTIARTFDGKNAVCEIKGDVGKRAYKAELVSDRVVENERRTVELKINLYKCDEVDGKFTLVKSNLSEVTHSYVLLPNGELGQTNNTVTMANFTLTDKYEHLLGVNSVAINAEDITLKYTFDSSVDSAFLTAMFKSTSEFPTGQVIDDVFEYYGGYVLHFSK